MEDLVIVGARAVEEALRARVPPRVIFILKGKTSGRLQKIKKIALSKKVKVVEVPSSKLDELSGGTDHRGIVAIAANVVYKDFDYIIDRASSASGIIVALDGITDVGNFGSIMRVCECVGVDGVVFPIRNSADVNAGVVRASCGAVFNLDLARVPNLSRALRQAKDKGFWIVALSPDAERSIYDEDYDYPLVVVFGSEYKGLRKGVKKEVDLLLRIPMRGTLESLNVSVACGIALYEIARKKGFWEASYEDGNFNKGR